MRHNGYADGAYTSPAFFTFVDSSSDPAQPEDQDDGDVQAGIDEDALDLDQLDDDNVSVPATSLPN